MDSWYPTFAMYFMLFALVALMVWDKFSAMRIARRIFFDACVGIINGRSFDEVTEAERLAMAHVGKHLDQKYGKFRIPEIKWLVPVPDEPGVFRWHSINYSRSA